MLYLHYLSLDRHEALTAKADAIGRQIGGWAKCAEPRVKGAPVPTRERMLDRGLLVRAYQAARRGKGRSPVVADWFLDWETRLLALRRSLEQGYGFGPCRRFVVRDPKTRSVGG